MLQQRFTRAGIEFFGMTRLSLHRGSPSVPRAIECCRVLAVAGLRRETHYLYTDELSKHVLVGWFEQEWIIGRQTSRILYLPAYGYTYTDSVT
jgi:hypothetical protein